MNNSLDSPDRSVKRDQYIRKSAAALIAYGVILVSVFGLAFLGTTVEESDWRLPLFFVADALIFTPLIVIPFGLVFIFKAFAGKEGSAVQRVTHLVLHLVFTVLSILVLAIFVMDVLHLAL